MNSLCFLIFLVIYTITHVLCLAKVPCVIRDDNCVTEGANAAYQEMVAGNPVIGLPTLEPVHVDLVETVTPTLNCTLSDIYLHKMKDCYPKKLTFGLNNNTAWHLYIICPRLEVESNFYIYGFLNNINFKGEGKCKIVYDDIHIGILGIYERYIGAEDKVHIKTKSYLLNILNAEGGVKYKFENIINGDSKLSNSAHKIINENWKILDNVIQKPMMHQLMGKFVDSTNIYAKARSVNELFNRKL